MTASAEIPLDAELPAGISQSRRGIAPGVSRSLILLALAIVVLCAGRFFSDGLPSWRAGEAIMTQSLFVAVLAFGQGLVMLIGGLDLSIPGVIALSATVLALWTKGLGHDVWSGLLLALGAAVLVGFINGFLIARFHIPAFIVTLAMGGILVGLTTGVTYGSTSPAAPDLVVTLFSGSGKALGIGFPVFIFLLVGVVGYLIQAHSRFGRHVYLFGSSSRAARLAGLPVRRIEITVYVVGALSSGIAGIMLLGFSGNAQLSLGDEWLIPAIAAVLVGGTIIGSGYGFWQATFASCLLLTTITVVIQATGLSQGWKNVLYGMVILLALLLMRRGTRNPIWAIVARVRRGS